MSAADLAARLQVTAASVSDIERSEHDHRIRLDTLERAAQRYAHDLGVWRKFRETIALPMGLVDNKVCAIDDTWTGNYRLDPFSAEQIGNIMRAQLEWKPQVDDEVVREEMKRLIDSGRLWK